MFLILVYVSLYGQAYPGCVFLSIYPGAREMDLAGVFSSIADNAFATYYNPAGLAFQKKIDFVYHRTNSLYFGRSLFFDPLPYIYSAFTFPIYEFTFGLFYDYYGGEIGIYGEYVEYYDYTFGVSFGHRILKNWGIGGNIKYIHSTSVYFKESKIDYWRPKTFAIDLGFLYKNKIKNFLEINNAFVLKNLGPKIGYLPGKEKNPLPYEIRIGNSLKFKFLELFNIKSNSWLIDWLKDKCYLLLAYDLRQDLYFEGKPWHSFGFELSLGSFFFNIGYFEDTDGWRGGVIVREGEWETNCISLFTYLLGWLFTGHEWELEYIQEPTWAIGVDFKFLRIEYGTDINIYKFYGWFLPYEANQRFTISLNWEPPFFK